jgi:signal peptidase II
MTERRLVLTIAALVVALDALSKALAVHFLTGRHDTSILGGAVHLDLYRNFAGPRNTFRGHPVLVSGMAMVAAAGIAVIGSRVRTRSSAVAVGLLLGAGVGNLLDRLLRSPGPMRGGVVDWLRPGWSSGSMNLADLAIDAAIVVFVIGSALAWWRARSRAD